MFQEIVAEDECALGRPIKGTTSSDLVAKTLPPLTSSEAMNPEKALGNSSIVPAATCAAGISDRALTTTRSAVVIGDEKQINQTHNDNVDGAERNINTKSLLRESLDHQQQQQDGKPGLSGGLESGQKSTASKAEQSFPANSRTTNSSAPQQEDSKENEREPKRAETKSASLLQSARVETSAAAAAAPEKAQARDKAPVAAALVSVELSKRSVAEKQSSRISSSNASAAISAVGSSTAIQATRPEEDKVVITSTGDGDKCRYASVFVRLVHK